VQAIYFHSTKLEAIVCNTSSVFWFRRTNKWKQWTRPATVGQPPVHVQGTGDHNGQLQDSAWPRWLWPCLWRLLAEWYSCGSQAVVAIFQSRNQRVLDRGNVWSSIIIGACTISSTMTHSSSSSGSDINQDSS
jgi:hypothetical protein